MGDYVGIIFDKTYILPHNFYTEKNIPRILRYINKIPILIISNKHSDDYFDKNNSLYDDIIFYDFDNINKELDKLSHIKYLINQGESEILLTDYLCNVLCIKCNPIKYSSSRLDKFLMNERLKECGLSYLKSCKCSNINDIIKFYNETKNSSYEIKSNTHYNCIHDSYICYTLNELIDTYYLILDETNDNLVYINEKLYGEKYIFNTISNNYIHKFISIWKSEFIHESNNENYIIKKKYINGLC